MADCWPRNRHVADRSGVGYVVLHRDQDRSGKAPVPFQGRSCDVEHLLGSFQDMTSDVGMVCYAYQAGTRDVAGGGNIARTGSNRR